MKFEESDKDWSDFHQGLTRARRRRYAKVLDGIIDALENILRRNADGHAINAMVPHGMFAVGVKGDARVYAPIVALTYDHFPGYDHLQRISQEITNSLPVSRVVYNQTAHVVCVEEVQFLVMDK
mgnify:CR=1 FL=1